jgi:hypothetical protein
MTTINPKSAKHLLYMSRGIKEELAEMARNVGDTFNESAPDQLSAQGKRKPGVYLVLVMKDKRYRYVPRPISS